MRDHHEAIRSRGAEVVAVSFEPFERLAPYIEAHGWPFPVVADPDGSAYRAFGLGSAGWLQLLRPRVIRRYLGLMARGRRPRASRGDVHRLGGDFVVDRERRVLFAHRSTDPADRPPVSALVRALP